MKKIFILLILLFTLLPINAKIELQRKHVDSRIEIVNEKTIIFKSIVKIDFKTSVPTQVTYVYDLSRGKLVKAVRGPFVVELPKGDYLVQSDKKITKTLYEIIIE